MQGEQELILIADYWHILSMTGGIALIDRGFCYLRITLFCRFRVPAREVLALGLKAKRGPGILFGTLRNGND